MVRLRSTRVLLVVVSLLAVTLLVSSTTSAEAAQRTKRYAFMYRNADGTPGRWNPCKRIVWKYNPAGQAAHGEADAKAAARVLKKVTGLPLVYRGRTKAHPYSFRKRPRGVDIVVGWGSKANVPVLGRENLLGYTTTRYKYWQYDNGSRTPKEIVIGNLVMNTAYRASAPRNVRRNAFIHEWGHIAGLDHSTLRSQIMYPTIFDNSPYGYGKWDKVGLRKLGRSHGCFARPLR